MSNEEIKQRIQYLVEHGGLYDEPLQDLRKITRLTLAAAVIVCLLTGLELTLIALD